MSENIKTSKVSTVKRAPKVSTVKRINEKKEVAVSIKAKKTPVKKEKKATVKVEAKVHVVRDSFTMPHSDYSKLGELKLACLKAGLQVKKSELLRAGLHVLSNLTVAQLKKTMEQIEQIKTGRPKNS